MLSPIASSAALPLASAPSGFSSDFSTFLAAHGYGHFAFAKPGAAGFGGRSAAGEAIVREPVIFVHGNSDDAQAFAQARASFVAAGYKDAELYALSWGRKNPALAGFESHTKAYLEELRGFFEAVLAYTGKTRIDIVTHSMGVTLARRAILGGKGVARDGAYDLGKPLTAKVDTFVGIAGANRGLTSAFFAPALPTASPLDGFYPGVLTPFGVMGKSRLLRDLDAAPHSEGQHVVSVWSPDDELVSFGAPMGRGLVWGEPTSRIPAQDEEVVIDGASHRSLVEKTGPLLVQLLNRKSR